MPERKDRPTVAIIGGGFSGAVVALRLAAQIGPGSARIVVFEPREYLGRGLAYDTDNPSHRINVPADRMSADPDNELDFVAWLEANGAPSDDPSSRTDDGKLYARRSAYGRYVSDLVTPYLRSGAVEHLRAKVSRVVRSEARWEISTEDGSAIKADFVVIATSHPAPSTPHEFDVGLDSHARFVRDSTVPHALDAIRQDDSVLIVGTGLTAADVIATLDARGHVGRLTFYSRRGLRSRGHSRTVQEAFGRFAIDPSQTAISLLRRIRATVREAEENGLTWHAAFDALRNDAGAVWHGLPIQERKKLVGRLRPFWDVHRFRIAPQVENVIERRMASGNLRLLAAQAIAVGPDGDRIWVTLRSRHGRGSDRSAYDAIVITTGPSHGGIFGSQPFMSEMAQAGFLELDGTGLGLACDDESHAITTGGGITAGVFISGPLARGTFGELMGLPQVSDHATLVASNLATEISAFAAQDPIGMP